MSAFERLPAEIRLEIYSYLNYSTALKLSRVSRYFKNDKPADGVDREQRATYIYHAETFRRNRKRLACYSCLRVRPRAEFLKDKRKGDFDQYGPKQYDRVCFDCQTEKGQIPWLQLRRLELSRKLGSMRRDVKSVLAKPVKGWILD